MAVNDTDLIQSARTMKGFLSIVAVLSLTLLSGCLSEKSLLGNARSELAATNTKGCIAAEPLSSSRIQITFEFPDGYTQVQIKRDGIVIASFNTSEVLSYIDTGLNEGQTYRYTCELKIGSTWVTGENRLVTSTLALNAPTFKGVTSTTVRTPHSMRVEWAFEDPNGVPAATFKVYANPGSTVNWNAQPRAEAPAGTLFAEVSGLGDQLNYAVGVRACSDKGFCDTNTATQLTVMSDDGPPATVGATSVRIENGKAVITAPWNEANGAIKKRVVYQRTGAEGGTDIANYIPVQTLVVADSANPPTTLTIWPLAEFTQYHFIVRDVDPDTSDRSGAANSSTQVVSLNSGDLTPPTFEGGRNLALGTPKDSTLTFDFTPIAREGTSDTGASRGASSYLVYLTSAPYGSTTANSCLEATPYLTLSAANFPPDVPQTYTLTGLNPRTTYSVCLKAQDAATNISSNNIAIGTKTTLDITAPVFDPIQSFTFNSLLAQLDLTWNPSESADLAYYVITLWKSGETKATGRQFIWPAVSRTSSASISKNEYNFTDGDVLYATVDACDSAAMLPGGTPNCTNQMVPIELPIPDATAPANFPGITSAVVDADTAQGQVKISWGTPAGGFEKDYKGFRIFSVENGTFVFLKDEPCTAVSVCPTTTLLTGLAANRNYVFNVQAYDADKKNFTLYTASIVASRRTKDTEAPIFGNSNLTRDLHNPYPLTWIAASDNQYEGNITYQVFVKDGSFFNDPTQPFLDGTRIDPSPATARTIPDLTTIGLQQGHTYYFEVCAVDAQSNRSCDGSSYQTLHVDDLTPPTINSFYVDFSDSKVKRWNLKYNVADNGVDQETLAFSIYHLTSSSSSATVPRDSDHLVSQTDTFLYTPPNAVTLTFSLPFTGELNQDVYEHYLLVVRDAAGNEKTAKTYKYSKNTITVSSVTNPAGALNTTNTILIKGTGFSKGSENGFNQSTAVNFAMGGQNLACTNLTVLSSEYLTCKTPASANVGTATLTISNPEGSSAGPLSYSYESAASSSDPCIKYASYTTSFPSTQDGYQASPFIICNKGQLALVGSKIASATNSYLYFKLGNHIDLSDDTTGTFKAAAAFRGEFDGASHAIMNYKRNEPTVDNVGLFDLISPNTNTFNPSVKNALIKNLLLLNFDVTGQDNVGALVGKIDTFTYASTAQINIENIYLSGKVAGRTNAGGLVGFVDKLGDGTTTTNPPTFKEITGVITASGTTDSTGTAPTDTYGQIGGVFGNFSWGAFTNTTGSLTVTTSSPTVDRIGGFAGTVGVNGKGLPSNITGLTMTSTLKGRESVGGAIGASYGYPLNLTMTNTNVTSNVDVAGSYAGGVMGYMGPGWGSAPNVTLTGLTVSSTVKATGSQIGGVFGQIGTTGAPNSTLTMNGATIDTTLTGSVANASTNGGGIGGYIVGTLNISKTSVKVNTGNSICTYVGGLFGRTGSYGGASTTTLSQISVTGNVNTPTSQVSGCVTPGPAAGLATNLTAGSTVTISDVSVAASIASYGTTGGLATTTNAGTISRVLISSPSISSGTGLSYAIAPSGTETFSNVYYTFGGNVLGNSTTPPTGAAKKTDTELKTQNSSFYSSFDFTSSPSVWYWPATSGVLPLPRTGP